MPLDGNEFIVDQFAPEFHQPFQHLHIIWLSFDCMGKEQVGFLFYQEMKRDLFYRQDNLC